MCYDILNVFTRLQVQIRPEAKRRFHKSDADQHQQGFRNVLDLMCFLTLNADAKKKRGVEGDDNCSSKCLRCRIITVHREGSSKLVQRTSVPVGTKSRTPPPAHSVSQGENSCMVTHAAGNLSDTQNFCARIAHFCQIVFLSMQRKLCAGAEL